MPEHVSPLMWMVVALPAALTAACVVGLARIRRGVRLELARRQPTPRLPALPPQPVTGPRREFVELTPAEQDAFAGLVRRLDDSH
ncbi:hypothetical protein [Streptomyces tropicalis]|uniref:Uncharacterized protein n=1 Tax=Streptomyces tropicalis TaxID=3034234 RepID=A0ABT6A819_9ACTN|nr:hypothetical protein [Streptomyces tropicalis]MDF3300592.1 hypothetical protein [Streptomyces tropicalis]